MARNPTARQWAEYRSLKARMQDFQERDRAEMAEYAAAVQRGDESTAREIAIRRHERSRAVYGQPMSIAESEAKRNGRAGDPPSTEDAHQRPGEAASPAPRLVRVPEDIAGTVFPCFVDADA